MPRRSVTGTPGDTPGASAGTSRFSWKRQPPRLSWANRRPLSDQAGYRVQQPVSLAAPVAAQDPVRTDELLQGEAEMAAVGLVRLRVVGSFGVERAQPEYQGRFGLGRPIRALDLDAV